MARRSGEYEFPDDATPEEMQRIMSFSAPAPPAPTEAKAEALRPSATPATSTPTETEFERTNPDVQASRRAERTEQLAGYGETAARTLRDASVLTLASLLTRGAGGGAILQALARIGASGGIAAAQEPGGLAERAEAGGLAAGTSGALEALMGIPALGGVLLRGAGRRIGEGIAGATRAPKVAPTPRPLSKVGFGMATGWKPSDFAPEPVLYGPTGAPVSTRIPALEHVEAGIPRLQVMGDRLRALTTAGPPSPPPPSSVGPLVGKSAVDAAGTQDPLLTLGAMLGLGSLARGSDYPGRYRGGAGVI